MNRAERRRAAKQVSKGQLDPYGQNTTFVPKAIVTNDGARYTSYEEWLHAVEDDISVRTAKKSAEIASQMLWDAEVYMTVWNIMAMLIAMDRVVGNLKTVQKSYQKIIDSYNGACEHIDSVGVRAAYEEFRSKYGIELEFDEADMNFIDDDGKAVYDRLKIRIGDPKTKEVVV